jgi:hypothetical protein
VLEAVVSGGEPLLRRELALEVLERLDRAGVATYLNTNGWFVDDAVADRLGALRGLYAFVSIDGATAARHDAMRGVAGSWRRAMEAASRLLDRGVRTRIVHVVTPENRDEVDDALELFWALGAGSTHLAPVTPIGAAARGGDWKVDELRLALLRERARRRYAGDMNVMLRTGGASSFDPLARPPATFLLRPDGVIRISSPVPFSFGHASDGLAAAWEGIRSGWDGPEVRRWLAAVRRRSTIPQAELIPYLDADAPAPGAPVDPAAGGRDLPLPAPTRARRPEHTTLAEATAFARGLALARRYRLGDVRSTDALGGDRLVRHRGTGVVTRLNPTAAAVLAACDGGTPGEALAVLCGRHPSVGEDRLAHDVLRSVRMLLARGLVVPAGARGGAELAPPGDEAAPTAALTG